MNWLESVEDVKVRKRVSPRVEQLKKQIDDLWSSVLIVEEGKSALKGFAKEFFIRGDDSRSPQDFLRKTRGLVINLMKNNPQTKVKPEFTPVFFHNLANYDAHLFVRSLGLEDWVLEVKCIPNNEENIFLFQ